MGKFMCVGGGGNTSAEKRVAVVAVTGALGTSGHQCQQQNAP